jgi:hypothetical protein
MTHAPLNQLDTFCIQIIKNCDARLTLCGLKYIYPSKQYILLQYISILTSYIVVHLCNCNKSRYGAIRIMDIIVSDVIANDEIHEDIYPILPTLTVYCSVAAI